MQVNEEEKNAWLDRITTALAPVQINQEAAAMPAIEAPAVAAPMVAANPITA